jgi:serine O-acetyltransferase
MDDVGRLLDRFHSLMTTGFTPSCQAARGTHPRAEQERFRIELAEAMRLCGHDAFAAEELAQALVAELKGLRSMLAMDVNAALFHDPAADSREEVEACYPGVRAIIAHRLAHRLGQANVPMLPRMIAEKAHAETGIDIHPGASIGERFFIDHGTGVVIGQTTVIGNDVTVYQGVTIGARNIPRDPSGKARRSGEQRHPTIGNNVVIYANATLLGGDTVIADDCVIGAGVWLVTSLDAGTMAQQEAPQIELRARAKKG